MEYRAFRAADGVAEDEEGALVGLIAPYGVRTRIGGDKYGFDEEIAPGNFTKSLRERDIVALDNHDTHRPLGRKSAGTLTFDDRSEGLHGKVVPPDTTYAVDLRKNVKAKNYGGWSFGFEVVKDEWRDDEGKPSDRYTGTHRILREVKLIEVSPVTFPAYGTTHIQARDSVLAEREAYALRADADGDDDGDKKPYGNVKYADPKNGKYPINSKERAKAAWSYINMPKNAAKYPLNGVSLASVKAAIKKALKKFGVKISEENEAQLALEWRSLGDDLLSQAADLLTAYNALPADQRDALLEEIRAGDEAPTEEPEHSTPEDRDETEALADWLRVKRHAMQAAEFEGLTVN